MKWIHYGIMGFLSLSTLSVASLAEEQHHPEAVIPAQEKALAAKHTHGPAQTSGVIANVLLGAIDLGAEFAQMEGHQLRARIIELEPKGVIAVHEHSARPGFAYILEGEILEHRSGAEKPVLRKAGQAAFEKTGVTHWWENQSNGVVRALVVDVFKP